MKLKKQSNATNKKTKKKKAKYTVNVTENQLINQEKLGIMQTR